MSHDLLTAVAPVILSGGLTGAVVSVYAARKKVPAERDSIVVSGAETAVTALERSLAAVERDRNREAALREKVEKENEQLRARIDALEAALAEAKAQAVAAVATIEDLQRVVSQLKADYPNGH